MGLYVLFFPQRDIGFSYPAVSYLVFFRFVFFHNVFRNLGGLVLLRTFYNKLVFEVLADLQAPVFVSVFLSSADMSIRHDFFEKFSRQIM